MFLLDSKTVLNRDCQKTFLNTLYQGIIKEESHNPKRPLPPSDPEQIILQLCTRGPIQLPQAP